MSISVVNGYLCMNSCDAAKARTGQDPHAQSAANQTPDAKTDLTQTPAVTFGGALAALNAITPAGTAPQAGALNGNPPSAGIDIHA